MERSHYVAVPTAGVAKKLGERCLAKVEDSKWGAGSFLLNQKKWWGDRNLKTAVKDRIAEHWALCCGTGVAYVDGTFLYKPYKSTYHIGRYKIVVIETIILLHTDK